MVLGCKKSNSILLNSSSLFHACEETLSSIKICDDFCACLHLIYGANVEIYSSASRHSCSSNNNQVDCFTDSFENAWTIKFVNKQGWKFIAASIARTVLAINNENWFFDHRLRELDLFEMWLWKYVDTVFIHKNIYAIMDDLFPTIFNNFIQASLTLHLPT